MRTLHAGLRVADLDRSLVFYKGIGYDVVGHVPETEFGSLTLLKLPGDEFVTLELVHDPAVVSVEPGGLNHFVIHVEAMHHTLTRLEAHGVHTEPPSSPDGSNDFWTCWLADPDGHRIELVQWPQGHPAGMTREDFSREGACEGDQ